MTENHQPLVMQLRDVVKAYQTGDGQFVALDHVNVDIFQAEFLGITGKSGAGKTTLLKYALRRQPADFWRSGILRKWFRTCAFSPFRPLPQRR